MIESSIVSWVEFSENLEYLDAYKRKYWTKIFSFMRFVLSYKNFSNLFIIFLKILFFIQVLMLSLTQVNDSSDNIINILKYISTVIFIQQIVSDGTTYKLAVIINSGITVILFLCILNAIISLKKEKVYIRFPNVLLNFFNLLIKDYLIGPIIQISILSTNCIGGLHLYLNVQCYTSSVHIIFLSISFVNLVFYFIYSIMLSVYYNEIGSIDQNKLTSRVNTNYEVYTNLAKILMFIFAYLVNFYGNNSLIFKLLLQVYILICAGAFFVYAYKNVLFYDIWINRVVLYGWIFVFWFSLVVILKTLLNINETTIIDILGWLIIFFSVYYVEEFKLEYLLTEFNIFNANNLKDIECFRVTLFNLMTIRNFKSQTFLAGIIKKFEEYLLNTDDLSVKYLNLCSNDFLCKKFSGSNLKIVIIMNIIYEYHLEKSIIKEDILFCYSYFLINTMKNIVLASFLCSKIKAKTHKQIYYKYTLMEEIKEYLANKIVKSGNKEAIKNIQLGSVILYDTYLNSFRTRICEAIGLQMEYFETLRNKSTNKTTTKMFLTLGEKILKLRKKIIKIWERIIELNPFSDSAWNDYELYINLVLQDDILLRTELKKYSNVKASQLTERNSTYNSIFDHNSSVLLIDGYNNFGNVLYCTPNFPHLFNFKDKEILNSNVDNFVPTAISRIHKEIVEHSLKYSNIGYIFKKERDMMLRNPKSDGIFSIRLYIKPLPNLSNGLIYITFLKKIIDNNFIIILDRDMKINSLPEPTGINNTYHSYLLDKFLIGFHIGHVLPEILLQTEYNQEEGFVFIKKDIDLKGNLYVVPPKKELNDYIGMILEKIKLDGPIQVDDNRQESLADYEELVKELNSISTMHHNVFFKIQTRTFYDGKMKYHKIIVSSDMITLNEDSKKIRKNMRIGDKVSSTRSLNKILGIDNIERKDSGKQIKIKLRQGDDHMATVEEVNKLLQENKINLVEKFKKEDLDKENDGENEGDKESRSHMSYTGTSAGSKSSLDSTSFNKLKNGILSEKEISSVKIMKYFTLLFGLGAIVLVFFSTRNSEDKFSNSQTYLTQNLFFNHTKILVSCMYYSTLNMKFLKNSIYTDSRCYLPCESFYSNSLTECLIDLKTANDYKNLFYDDYIQIIATKYNIELNVYGSDQPNTVLINADSHLNLLVAFGLKFEAELANYFNIQDSLLDTLSMNLLTQSMTYLSDINTQGFDKSQLVVNLENFQSNVNIPLIIQICLFTILIFLFIYFFCSFYSIESYYLSRLIKFKNNQFDAYIKKLDTVNKTMKNNQDREEEEVIEDLDENNKFYNNDENLDKKKTNFFADKLEVKKDKTEKSTKNRKAKKEKAKSALDKKNNKKKHTHNYREEKINIMKSYFLNWNIIFTLNVILILFLSASYYIILSSFNSSTSANLLNLDSTINSIEGVYKTSFDTYLSIKTELSKYIDYEIQKTQNPNTIDQSSHYKMNIPQSVTLPVMGNLLLNLVDISSTSSTTTTVSTDPSTTLFNLYNSDACAILFDSTNDALDYSTCENFWSGILTKGIEQSLTQMNVAVTSVIDDLYSLNTNLKTLDDVIEPGSAFSSFELFVEFYLFKAYYRTFEIFQALKTINLTNIDNKYQTIMISYMCFTFILFLSLLYFVYKAKYIFICFMNFIGIIPAKFLIEDASFYRDIIRLERYIYY